MGLAATIAGAVATGFTALDDLVQTGTYRHRSAVAYASDTGLATELFTDGTTVGVVLADYTREERVDSALQPEDRMALIRAAELTMAPAIGDRLEVAGQTLDVVGISTDPVTVLWTLQVRRAA